MIIIVHSRYKCSTTQNQIKIRLTQYTIILLKVIRRHEYLYGELNSLLVCVKVEHHLVQRFSVINLYIRIIFLARIHLGIGITALPRICLLLMNSIYITVWLRYQIPIGIFRGFFYDFVHLFYNRLFEIFATKADVTTPVSTELQEKFAKKLFPVFYFIQ